MSIPKWNNPAENLKNLVTLGSPVAVPMNATDDINNPETLYLYNISKETMPEGTEAATFVRDTRGHARSQFALCALKNTLAVPLHFITKVAMVFTLSHFCCGDPKPICSDRAIAWIKDLARIFVLPFAWLVLIATALFAAIYPSACLRNAVATLESALLENENYEILRARPRKYFIQTEETPSPVQLPKASIPSSTTSASNSALTTSVPVPLPTSDKPTPAPTPVLSTSSLTVEPKKKSKTVSFAPLPTSSSTLPIAASGENPKSALKSSLNGIFKKTNHKLSYQEMLIKTASAMATLTEGLNDDDALFADPTPDKTAAKKSGIVQDTAKRLQIVKEARARDKVRAAKKQQKTNAP